MVFIHPGIWICWNFKVASTFLHCGLNWGDRVSSSPKRCEYHGIDHHHTLLATDHDVLCNIQRSPWHELEWLTRGNSGLGVSLSTFQESLGVMSPCLNLRTCLASVLILELHEYWLSSLMNYRSKQYMGWPVKQNAVCFEQTQAELSPKCSTDTEETILTGWRICCSYQCRSSVQ